MACLCVLLCVCGGFTECRRQSPGDPVILVMRMSCILRMIRIADQKKSEWDFVCVKVNTHEKFFSL